MEKDKNIHLFTHQVAVAIVIIFTSFTNQFIAVNSFKIAASTNYDSTFFVAFDPYVSILDKYNRNRYGTDELFPIVAKVAEKFTRIFIQLSWKDLQNINSSVLGECGTSICRSPLAIAKYNADSSFTSFTSKSKLEVWLAYSHFQNTANASGHDSREDNILPDVAASNLQLVAEMSNEIFNGTVTALLLPQTYTDQLKIFSKRYQTGLVLNSSICKYDPDNVQGPVPQIIIDTLPEFVGKLTVSQSNVKCHNKLSKNNINTAIMLSISDTYNYNRVNMSGLVSSWYKLNKWSNSTGVNVILSKAFDTPYEANIHGKTCGWWRLIEDAKYSSTRDFIFQEKAIVAKEFDREEEKIDFAWLKQENNFSRDHLGIIYSLYDPRRTAFSPYSEQELAPMLQSVSKIFSKVLVLIADDGLLRVQTLLYEVRTVAQLSGEVEMMIMLMPHVRINKYFSENLHTSAKEFGFDPDLFTTIIISFTGEETIKFANNFVRKGILAAKDPASYRLGFAFNISLCGSYKMSSSHDKQLINEILHDRDTQGITFYFEDDEETVRLGAKRMFQQRIILFEECRRFLAEQNVSINSETNRLTFAMLHYGTYTNFYRDPWALYNFVKYWDMISEWGRMTGTTVIMSSAVDGTRTFRDYERTVSEMGWWKYQELSKDNPRSAVPLKDTGIWIDKKKETLLVANFHFQKDKVSNRTTGLSTVQIILIVLLPIIISMVVVTLGLMLMRRYYQESHLTKCELNDFFLGDKLATEDGLGRVNKVPYDKTRFEIDATAFSIEDGKLLGSGEFGRVCTGKIKREQEEKLNVAVKMANPLKFQKTTLQGLLTEIKVLAHLGKHKNIIELLGANTAELKTGKIFIFLELCQLGSLEKYLQKIRPQAADDQNSSLQFDLRYVNTKVKKMEGTSTLDSLLSDDLYRWAQEICDGMAYLAKKHVVHADLATRNVLLNLSKEAKICDFGLSRRMYNYASYVKQHQEPLPWKWMAPESLRINLFNEKSDVWAYGITLWEIYSLGDAPYPGLSWDSNFPQMLQLGFRMSEPQYNDRDMHSIMKQCWNLNPDRRPSFAELQLEYN